MRIISGKFKGHKLSSFDENHIRPMTDRVKESLFNILAPCLGDARVLDLYAGTGNLSLEALSWGARTADLVENNPRSLKLIEKNTLLLGVASEVNIHRDEAINFLKKYRGDSFDIIFIDPPFPSKICLSTLEAVSQSAASANDSRIIIEHSKHEPLPEAVLLLRRVDTRNYGDKILTFYRKESH